MSARISRVGVEAMTTDTTDNKARIFRQYVEVIGSPNTGTGPQPPTYASGLQSFIVVNQG